MSLLENLLLVLKAPQAKVAAAAAVVLIVGYSLTSKKSSDKVKLMLSIDSSK
jgi:hypothetical protein